MYDRLANGLFNKSSFQIGCFNVSSGRNTFSSLWVGSLAWFMILVSGISGRGFKSLPTHFNIIIFLFFTEFYT